MQTLILECAQVQAANVQSANRTYAYTQMATSQAIHANMDIISDAVCQAIEPLI